MKATVIVTLKPTVLDPQGITIHRSVQAMGFSDVVDVRQGKYFEVNIGDKTPSDQGKAMVERLAKEVLTNPVIEEYKVVWEQK
jgi:phosphoribosylformylglycinamidine synthase subunit PurS